MELRYRMAVAERAQPTDSPPETAEEEAELLDRIDRLKMEVRDCALEHAREAQLVNRLVPVAHTLTHRVTGLPACSSFRTTTHKTHHNHTAHTPSLHDLTWRPLV